MEDRLHRGKQAEGSGLEPPQQPAPSSLGEPAAGAQWTTIQLFGVTLDRVEQDEDLQEAGVLWPCTRYIAALLEQELSGEGLAGKRVLELGAGTGALGIAAACRGAHSVVTDLEPVLPLIRRNAQVNGRLIPARGHVDVVAHAWGTDTSALRPPFDAVLACETLYWGGWDLLQDDTRALLLASLRGVAEARTKVLLAFTVRDRARELGFVEMCAAHFHTRLMRIEEPSRDAGGVLGVPDCSGGSQSGACILDDVARAVRREDVEEGDVVLAVLTTKEP